jgi:hypothetical protein
LRIAQILLTSALLIAILKLKRDGLLSSLILASKPASFSASSASLLAVYSTKLTPAITCSLAGKYCSTVCQLLSERASSSTRESTVSIDVGAAAINA